VAREHATTAPLRSVSAVMNFHRPVCCETNTGSEAVTEFEIEDYSICNGWLPQ
jgi:hypothetical protein